MTEFFKPVEFDGFKLAKNQKMFAAGRRSYNNIAGMACSYKNIAD
jgi:hypothetical protein